jgi:ParB family chromosome partitioning protein
LREVPCIEMDVDEKAVAEIALIENMQRKDLTAWEEADGLAALCERFGYTHEDVARKVGKSRSTVTEALSIATLPEVIREKCRRADISAKSLLLQIVRQPNIESMNDILGEITALGLNRDEARAVRRSKREVKHAQVVELKSVPHIYTYQAKDGTFKLEVLFRDPHIEFKQLADALNEALSDIQDKISRLEGDND